MMNCPSCGLGEITKGRYSNYCDGCRIDIPNYVFSMLIENTKLREQLKASQEELAHIHITADEYYHIKWDCGHIGAYSPRRHCPYCEIANEADIRKKAEQQLAETKVSLALAVEALEKIRDKPHDGY